MISYPKSFPLALINFDKNILFILLQIYIYNLNMNETLDLSSISANIAKLWSSNCNLCFFILKYIHFNKIFYYLYLLSWNVCYLTDNENIFSSFYISCVAALNLHRLLCNSQWIKELMSWFQTSEWSLFCACYLLWSQVLCSSLMRDKNPQSYVAVSKS